MAASKKRRGKRQIRYPPDLPEDVITDILTRLPVKSLLRFRCVSKSFLTIIASPYFIKRHLNHSLLTKSNHRLILLQQRSIYSVDLYKLNQTLELDHPLKSNQLDTEFIGSVNGLLCLYNEKEDIAIWNVATRNYQKVPVSKIKFPDYKCFIPHVNYGFGYDSVSDDYKLLRVVRFYGTDEYSTNSEAKVYSLRSNSWQRIQDFPYHIRYVNGRVQQVCGALHWRVTQNRGSDINSSIAAFDLAMNKYKLIDHPEFQNDDIFDLTKLEGHLSMSCIKSCGRIDVWVMKEYGVNESWTKLLSLKPELFREFLTVDPLAYSKSGTEIMLVQDYKKLLWYSLEEGKVRTIRLRGRPVDFEPEICVESLVPLSEKAKNRAKRKGGKIQKCK